MIELKTNDESDFVANIRRFNRFYTPQIGLLDEHILRSDFSLTEVRIMYEIANGSDITAARLAGDLRIDAGQLSRTIKGLEAREMISREPNLKDARQTFLRLSEDGSKRFAELNVESDNQIRDLIDGLSSNERVELTNAMADIQRILSHQHEVDRSYVLRPPLPGDLGWVVTKHGEYYARVYDWSDEFEGLVAGIMSDFVKNYDPKRERCWIAEKDGENVGSVFLVKQSDTTAKLRCLIVDESAQGLGIGKRLVDECTSFARKAGYKKITLWTNSILLPARGIYEKAGYRPITSEAHHSFGHDLISETWELDL